MINIIAKLLISGTVFTMCNGGPVPERCCTPPDRLDVVMRPGVPTRNDIVECEDWGGELIFDPTTNLSTCEGVDY
jgi:hypothetical protein